MGGGIAGIQAALDLAGQNIKTYLVEKKPSIGGHMAMLDKTFPTLDCSACILTPKMVEVDKHPKIRLYTYTEVKNIEGRVGNFKVELLKKPRYVQEDICTGCGECVEVCPVEVQNEFDRGFGVRKAIYIPFPQAIPLRYTIDKESCISCKLCNTSCKANAINHEEKPQIIELNVSAIIVATGYEIFNADYKITYYNYGYKKYSNVLTTLDFERFLNGSGPTLGHPIRLSDGKIPKRIAFIQCVGSRDPNQGIANCSRVCCMVSIKQAILAKEHIPGCEISIFYIDIRAFGKYFEEFYNMAKERYNINFIRGKVAEIKENYETKNLIVKVENTETGEFLNKEVDLAILSIGGKISKGSVQIKDILENKFHIPFVRDDGFFIQIDPEISAVDTNIPGIYVTGYATGPRDIPDSVAYGSAAAMRAALIAKEVE
ncbi:MAG: 4Fe-4S binding protein [Candidatus Hodarchaeota archaeon]